MHILSHTEKKMFNLISEDKLVDFQIAYEQSEFVDKKVTNKDGATFFGDAIAKGALKIIDYLAKQPEAVETEDDNKRLPIFHVSRAKNKRQVLAVLYKNKVDLGAISSEGRNIFHGLAPLCDKDTWQRLVKVGVDQHQEDNRGTKPTDIAKRYRNMEVLQLSDMSGFDPN